MTEINYENQDRTQFEKISMDMLALIRHPWIKVATDDVSITYRIFISDEEQKKQIDADLEQRRVEAVLWKKFYEQEEE
tara:strand:- start:1 stop:234 length:234 start_codon:yes stop_codon:yes gene_type:complete